MPARRKGSRSGGEGAQIHAAFLSARRPHTPATRYAVLGVRDKLILNRNDRTRRGRKNPVAGRRAKSNFFPISLSLLGRGRGPSPHSGVGRVRARRAYTVCRRVPLRSSMPPSPPPPARGP